MRPCVLGRARRGRKVKRESNEVIKCQVIIFTYTDSCAFFSVIAKLRLPWSRRRGTSRLLTWHPWSVVKRSCAPIHHVCRNVALQRSKKLPLRSVYQSDAAPLAALASHSHITWRNHPQQQPDVSADRLRWWRTSLGRTIAAASATAMQLDSSPVLRPRHTAAV